MWTYNRLDLRTLGSRPIMPKNLPDNWLEWLLWTQKSILSGPLHAVRR